MIAESAQKPTEDDGFRAESVITPRRDPPATVHTLEVDRDSGHVDLECVDEFGRSAGNLPWSRFRPLPHTNSSRLPGE
jgi:hypothetical protein